MVELKRKVTLKTKNSSIVETEEPIAPNPTPTKSRKKLLGGLAALIVVVIAGFVLFGNNQSTGNSDAVATDSLTKDSVQKDSTIADTLKKEKPTVVSNEESNNTETEDKKENMQSNESVPVDTNVKSLQESNAESSSIGSVEAKAKQVIRGIYGNGSVRKQKLGNDYAEIQGKVNEMYRNGLVH